MPLVQYSHIQTLTASALLVSTCFSVILKQSYVILKFLLYFMPIPNLNSHEENELNNYFDYYCHNLTNITRFHIKTIYPFVYIIDYSSTLPYIVKESIAYYIFLAIAAIFRYIRRVKNRYCKRYNSTIGLNRPRQMDTNSMGSFLLTRNRRELCTLQLRNIAPEGLSLQLPTWVLNAASESQNE